MQDVLSSGTDRQGWPFCRFTEDVKPTIVCCAPFTHSKQSPSCVLIMIEDQGGGIKTDPLSSTHYGIWYLFRFRQKPQPHGRSWWPCPGAPGWSSGVPARL